MNDRHSDSKIVIIYLVVLLSILLGFGALWLYCRTESAKERTYEFTSEKLNVPQEGLSISINVPPDKQWDDAEHHPVLSFGAQYDGMLTNNNSFTFKNWSGAITFSDDLQIDSSWNGDFSLDGRTISFTAINDTATVVAHRVGTFGAILYSKELLHVANISIKGYFVYRMIDFPVFWALIICSVLWLLTMVFQIIIHMRTERYRIQQELDSRIIEQSMNTFISFIDEKDSYTKGHSARVAAYASEIARRMKLSKEQVSQIYYITLMHDCGKIGIPDSILKKPGKLTPEEYEIIKSHTTKGDAVLVNFTAIPGIRDGAHYHHERYDGNGYPEGLKGDDIPLFARIICVADSYDAMSSNRCYRGKLTDEKIRRELTEHAGNQFDPRIIPYIISMIEDGFTAHVQSEYPSSGDSDDE